MNGQENCSYGHPRYIYTTHHGLCYQVHRHFSKRYRNSVGYLCRASISKSWLFRPGSICKRISIIQQPSFRYHELIEGQPSSPTTLYTKDIIPECGPRSALHISFQLSAKFVLTGFMDLTSALVVSGVCRY